MHAEVPDDLANAMVVARPALFDSGGKIAIRRLSRREFRNNGGTFSWLSVFIAKRNVPNATSPLGQLRVKHDRQGHDAASTTYRASRKRNISADCVRRLIQSEPISARDNIFDFSPVVGANGTFANAI